MRISNGQQIRFMVILQLGNLEAPIGANERTYSATREDRPNLGPKELLTTQVLTPSGIFL